MEQLVAELKQSCEDLIEELETVTKTKASAARARKLTSEIASLGKEFRKESIAFHKK